MKWLGRSSKSLDEAGWLVNQVRTAPVRFPQRTQKRRAIFALDGWRPASVQSGPFLRSHTHRLFHLDRYTVTPCFSRKGKGDTPLPSRIRRRATITRYTRHMIKRHAFEWTDVTFASPHLCMLCGSWPSSFLVDHQCGQSDCSLVVLSNKEVSIHFLAAGLHGPRTGAPLPVKRKRRSAQSIAKHWPTGVG